MRTLVIVRRLFGAQTDLANVERVSDVQSYNSVFRAALKACEIAQAGDGTYEYNVCDVVDGKLILDSIEEDFWA